MQKSVRFFALLTFTMTCAIVFSFCDQPEIRADTFDSHDPAVSVRTDYEECSECCCAITLDDDTAVTLQLCGTEDGLSTCTDTGLDCEDPDLNGGGQFVVLTTATVIRHVFCMIEGTTLRITNTSTTDGADITLTCQFDSGLPQTLQISLGPEDMLYYDVETGCIVSECN